MIFRKFSTLLEKQRIHYIELAVSQNKMFETTFNVMSSNQFLILTDKQCLNNASLFQKSHF